MQEQINQLVDEFRQKLDELMRPIEYKDFIAEAKNRFPDGIRIVDFTGIDGVDYGYTFYDFNNQVIVGYKVNCWGSHAFGGSCNCINHDPGEYSDLDMNVSHLPELRRVIAHNLINF